MCSGAGITPHFLMSDWGDLILSLAEWSNGEDCLMRLVLHCRFQPPLWGTSTGQWTKIEEERVTEMEQEGKGIGRLTMQWERRGEGKAIAIQKCFCCGSVWRLRLPVVENVNGKAAFPLQGFSTQPLREPPDRRANTQTNKQTHPQKL